MGYLPQSHHRGVTYESSSGKWVASVPDGKRSFNLGSFDNYNDACKIQEEAESDPIKLEELTQYITTHNKKPTYSRFDMNNYISDERFCDNANQLVDCYKTFIKHKKAHNISIYEDQEEVFYPDEITDFGGKRIA